MQQQQQQHQADKSVLRRSSNGATFGPNKLAQSKWIWPVYVRRQRIWASRVGAEALAERVREKEIARRRRIWYGRNKAVCVRAHSNVIATVCIRVRLTRPLDSTTKRVLPTLSSGFVSTHTDTQTTSKSSGAKQLAGWLAIARALTYCREGARHWLEAASS